MEEALHAYDQALALKPDYAEAHHNRLELLEKLNRENALVGALADARKHAGEDPRFALAEARLCKRRKDFQGALQLLETMPALSDVVVKGVSLALRGEVCDRLGDTAGAMAAFREANARMAEAPKWQRVDPRRFRRRAREMLELLEQWRDHPPSAPGPSVTGVRQDPVFLVGFPRSGTTLLDTILRTHSMIEVVEESPALDRAETLLRANTASLLEALERRDPAPWQRAREEYYTELERHCTKAAEATRVIIDRYPLHAARVPMIKSLFPSARFLLALRHPCDAVLSCFMQQFAPNDAMANFFTLEDSARLYDLVMRAWQESNELWDLPVRMVRYEDLIGDLEGTVQPVLAFLGC